MNAPDSIFCTRLGGTGGIDEPEVNVEVTKHVVGCRALLGIWWEYINMVEIKA